MFLLASFTNSQRFKIPYHRSIRARSQVEHWLLNFENVMFDTIKSLIKKAIPEFQRNSLLTWIDQHNGQVTSVVIQVLFSKEVEKIWTAENPLEQLEVFLVSMKEKLDLLASHVADSMQQYQRNTIVTLLIILVHERDIVMSLLEHKVVSAKNFQWTRWVLCINGFHATGLFLYPLKNQKTCFQGFQNFSINFQY